MAAELLSDLSRATDSNSDPLAGAKWDFYASGTSTRQSVFTSAALTTPLSNPVVADAGGQFPAIYFNSELSYRGVQTNAAGAVLKDIDPINPGVLHQLGQASGAGSIGYARTGQGGEKVAGKLDRILEVEDFRFTSNGVERSDLDTFLAAIARWQTVGGGRLSAQDAREYDFGSFTTAAITEVLAVSGLRDAEFDGRGCTFKLNSTTVGARPMLWVLRNFKTLALRNFKVTDIGTDLTVDWRGVYAVVPTMDGASGHSTDLTVENVGLDKGVAGYFTQGTVCTLTGQRIRMSAENAYYGAVFAECGDVADLELRLKNCRRAYFPYGVRGHHARLYVEHIGGYLGAETLVLVKRYQKNTGEIDIDLFVKGTLSEHVHMVTIEHQPDSGTGIIENVNARFHIDGGVSYDVSAAAQAIYGVPAGTKCVPMALRSFTSGGTEETSTTSNIWRKISVGGDISGAPDAHIDVRVKPTTPVAIALAPECGANPLKCTTKGNVRFKTASNREFLTRVGNQTTGTLDIDLSRFDNQTLEIGVDLSLYGAVSGAADQDQTSRTDTLFLRIPAGGPISVRGSPNVRSQSVGVAASSVTYGVSGKVLQITVAGSAYAGSSALGIAELTFRGQA